MGPKGSTLTKDMFLNHLYGGMDEPELKIIDAFRLQSAQEAQQRQPGQESHRDDLGRGYVLHDNVAASRAIAS